MNDTPKFNSGQSDSSEKGAGIFASLKELVVLQLQASGFSFLPKQPVHSILSGHHSSRLRGRGLNFEELRHYHAVDDIRTMDWKGTNRTGKPEWHLLKERMIILYCHSRMFVAGINSFTGWIPAKNIPE